MSSYIAKLTNPKTGKKQMAWCLDNFYGGHRYGYAFKKDGSDLTMNDNALIDCDIFNEDELNKVNQFKV